ncbi:uncharacterized protein LOC105685635 [Athalia rosae]|uniref:uncharacterized protein LOC105685635 n=1 Tax=Athalia rosae TaxID=37344 RepID=UPI002033BB49|nr:uncharacterized protein LOC105685635 [Athalia rosae]XP_020707645.2 uncharacterized protein LOC105685635 [Athalia rosae]
MQGMARRDLQAPSGDLVIAPRVPHGLAAAVEGLTREVIRHRPEDIYVFAAQHFEELLKLRDEFGAVTNLPGKSSNTAALREMNQSLKKRDCSSNPFPFNKDKNSPTERGSGWSMNETAKVLERHRSIFGDKGRKVSPEEIRALASEKENKSETYTGQRRRGSNERFVQRKLSREFEDEKLRDKNISRSDSNGNLKIISQIPKLPGNNGGAGLLAKDIKSELRKNRNSSRNVRGYKQKAEKRTDRFDGGAKKASLARKSEFATDNSIECEQKLQKMNETDNQKYETDNKKSSRSFAKIPRTLSMDRVRKFVVEKFRASESWEELRSTDYVGRVQEVIDGAAPSILKRVQELNPSARVKPGRRLAERGGGYESIDDSTSTSTRSDKSNQTDDVRSKSAMSVSRRSRRPRIRRPESRSKISTTESRGADSLEGIETLASEMEQVIAESKNSHGIIQGPATSVAVIDSVGIITTIDKTINGFKGELLSDPEDVTDPVRKSSSGSSSISLPAVRPPSSKNNSRSVSRTECDDLVLPPIPPEAPRSAKLKEEIILPSLLQVIVGGSGKSDFAELDPPDAPDGEIFKDSLNVTPEVGGTPRPDSLEPGENIAERRAKFNELEGQTDPEKVVETKERQHKIEEKLMNIEDHEKKIAAILLADVEGIIDDDVDGETIAPVVSVKEKLMEIQEAQVRLRNVLDRDTGKQELAIPEESADPGIKETLIETHNQASEEKIERILQVEDQKVEEDREPDTMIKEKLMEVEETAKRIERILNMEPQEIKAGEPESASGEKFFEIEEPQKGMEQKFETDTQEIEKLVHENHDMDSFPKTPLIPEIPCEYVTTPQKELSENPVEERELNLSAQSIGKSPENIETDEEQKEDNEDRLSVGRITLATPDSLGTSYVLTEGSPYEIPESVTTVIFPERQLESVSSDVDEIVLKNEPIDDRDSPSEYDNNVDVSLENILDNFSETVQKEPVSTSIVDVDLIRRLKTPEDSSIPKKDLGLITEEEGDREIVETEKGVRNVDAEHAQEDATTQPKITKTEDVEEIPNAEEIEREETDTLPLAEVNATDSGVTDSTDEVKETTISDDCVNTGAESSGQSSQSESAEILLGVRNSESSNEVKETTISDQPLDEGGKNLYGLGQQCHGIAPNVPELNLDSLQDITVSSFQLSDDATADEEDKAHAVSENEIPEHDSNEEDQEFSHPKKVDEDGILNNRALVEEVPDSNEDPHPIGIDNENLELTSEKIPDEQTSLKSIDSQMDTVSLNDFKALEANFAAEFSEEVIPADIADKKEEESEGIRETIDQKLNNAIEFAAQITSNEAPDLSIPEKEEKLPEDSAKTDIVANDPIDNEGSGDKMEYHIYVPELITASEDFSTTTESSTFNSAATKIQAGVRGFLTRRRLQSAQRRSSTLDSVPSIQDSLATDATHLEPIEEVGFTQAATTIQSGYRGYKARQRLRREDAVQKTTLSVENVFGGNGLRHTGEFHDCLPLPIASNGDEKNSIGDVISDSEGHEDGEIGSDGQRSRETTEPRHRDEENRVEENMGTIADRPSDPKEMNLVAVVTSGNESTLQTQYLNFITSVEEVPREMESSMVSDKVLDDEDYTYMKSNVGIENLPVDISGENSSVSLREPLAIPGTFDTDVFIEELSKTEEREVDGEPTEDVTGDEIKTDTMGNSLDLPGLSLDGKDEAAEDVPRVVFEEQVNPEVGVALESTDSLPQDANSLGTMSLSINVDDMLGLGGGESDLPSKIKPILEVTVTPRDLLKLTNRSEGSQASRDRIESPVTMMQIVPKSIEEKSDRSEEAAGDEERKKSIENPEDSDENLTKDPINTTDADSKI